MFFMFDISSSVLYLQPIITLSTDFSLFPYNLYCYRFWNEFFLVRAFKLFPNISLFWMIHDFGQLIIISYSILKTEWRCFWITVVMQTSGGRKTWNSPHSKPSLGHPGELLLLFCKRPLSPRIYFTEFMTRGGRVWYLGSIDSGVAS